MLPWAQLIKQEQGLKFWAPSPRCISQDFANSLQVYGPLQIYEWMNQITVWVHNLSPWGVTIQQDRHPLQNRSTSESDVTCDGGLEKGLRNTTLFIDVWQKSNQYYKVIILQLNRNKLSNSKKREIKKHNLETWSRENWSFLWMSSEKTSWRRGHLS